MSGNEHLGVEVRPAGRLALNPPDTMRAAFPADVVAELTPSERRGLALIAPPHIVSQLADHRREQRGRFALERDRPSIAGVHESAHVFVGLRYGCEYARGFVDRGGQTGRTHARLPKYSTDPTTGRMRRDRLRTMRARVAIDMAGVAAERIFKREPVDDYEQLLVAEGLSPDERDRYANPVEALFLEATAEWRGDHHAAADWLRAMLRGVRRRVIELLHENWDDVIKEAHRMDAWWREVA